MWQIIDTFNKSVANHKISCLIESIVCGRRFWNFGERQHWRLPSGDLQLHRRLRQAESGCTGGCDLRRAAATIDGFGASGRPRPMRVAAGGCAGRLCGVRGCGWPCPRRQQVACVAWACGWPRPQHLGGWQRCSVSRRERIRVGGEGVHTTPGTITAGWKSSGSHASEARWNRIWHHICFRT
jgi:hypothetical protein